MTDEEQSAMMQRKLAHIREVEMKNNKIVHGQKHIISEIMSDLLPQPERKEFKKLTCDVGSEDFFRLLAIYFNDEEIKTAISRYVCSQLVDMEIGTGAKIDAVLTIYGTQFSFGSYNEVAGI
jgi:hypothetical protein